MEKVDVCRRGHVNPSRNKWGACRLCLRVTVRSWAKANPEKVKASQKKWDAKNRHKLVSSRRKYLYGVTSEQVDACFIRQGRRCAICRQDKPLGRGSWHVDHDHKTNKFRGMLCSNCNTALGLLFDNPVTAEKAAAYLRNHGK